MESRPTFLVLQPGADIGVNSSRQPSLGCQSVLRFKDCGLGAPIARQISELGLRFLVLILGFIQSWCCL